MGDSAPRTADGHRSDGGSAGSPDDAFDSGQSEARRAVVAQRLAALALAKNDEDLVDLQRAGFAPERTPSHERLAMAKAVVDLLGQALESNAEIEWSRVQAALAALAEVVDEAAVTDEDRGRPDVAMMSTDVPPPPEPGAEPTQRGDAVDLSALAVPLPAVGLPTAADSERTAVSALGAAQVPEETMVSAAPVDAVVAELARRARLADLAETTEHTLVEAGVIEDAMNRARELLDSAQPPEASGAGGQGRAGGARSEEGGTVQLSFSSLAHGFALTVQEYAALCAERDDDPSRVGALRARYGIPEVRGHAALDRYFEQLFARDPAMKALWQHHYRRYSALVQQRA